ncbi:MAG: peptidase family protein [Friedmanniella sp.]|nr:peptidase family protein [Friedmanniella sp.]
MSQPPAGPEFSPPGFVGCYQHPERMTGISCQRCRRPICGECMNSASVGFQCPRCVGRGRSTARAPRTRFGASVTRGGSPATKVLMGALVAVWLVDLVSRRGLATSLLAMSNDLVYSGELWRLLTAAFTSGQLLGVLMNLLVLWLVGRAVESELGPWRFVTLYLAAGLGGTTLFFLVAPYSAAALGATAAIIGLLAANAIGKRKTGEDIRPDIGLLVLIVLYSVLIGFSNLGWLMLVGGIVAGGVVGYILAYAPRRNRSVIQVVGLLGMALLCLAGVAVKLVVTL